MKEPQNKKQYLIELILSVNNDSTIDYLYEFVVKLLQRWG